MIRPIKKALENDFKESLYCYKNRIQFKSRFPFLTLDCMENISHDMPDGHNITVYDAHGVPIFGLVVPNSKGNCYAKLEHWEYVSNLDYVWHG